MKWLVAGLCLGAGCCSLLADPPMISDIPDQRTFPSVSTRVIPFTVGDAQTAATNLVLGAISTNTTLVPAANIVFGGSGSNRTVIVTPASGQKGITAITVTVTNTLGETASDSFVVTVADFAQINAGLTGVSGGSAAWGDYDKDGDLDILLNGLEPSGAAVTRVYQNDGNGVFTDVGASLLGLVGGGAAWGDYDNDGDLDIMLTGNTAAHVMSWRIYRNDGSNVFTVVAAPYDNAFSGVDYRFVSLAWGDSDNDGQLDALFAGWPASALFRNNRNDTFSNTGLSLPDAGYSSVAWADYDNDGDQDFVLAEGYPAITRLYRNEGYGVFTVLTNILPGIYESSVAWGDIDNDGDLDIALTGFDSNVWPSTLIYRSDGSGNFTNTFASLPGTTEGSVAWGDFDNDGDLDLLLCGFGQVQIYRNDGNGTFTDSGISLPYISEGNAAWGDFDNDGDLDILIAGGGTAQVWRNDGAMPNAPPIPPGSLSAVAFKYSATFNWSAATDANQTGGLTYNLRVGTTPGGSDVCGPMADASTGHRRIPALGNANLRLGWTLTNLAAGTYYWSVQAVDHTFAGSAFAPEQTFALASPTITTNPENQSVLGGGNVTFTATVTGTEPLSYQWQFNGTNLLGATNASLLLTNLHYDQRGNYSLFVTNLYGSATSAVAVLTVLWPPTITAQPQSLVALEGTNVTFSVIATGAPPLLYQWQFNGTNISGATNTVLTIPTITASAAGNYVVQVTNDFGFTNSATAVLQVTPTLPIIVAQPAGQSVPVGINVTFHVGVMGTAPLAYQWRFNDLDLDGATNSVLKLNAVQFTNAGVYMVRVTNSLGATLSSNATLTVNPLGQGLKTISAPGAVDMAYDSARDVLCITSGDSVLRYHLGTETFLTPFQLGGTLWGVDVSFDGNWLAVADRAHTDTNLWIYVVNLVSNESRQVVFEPPWVFDSGSFSVAFGSDGAVFVTSPRDNEFQSSFRRYDPVTDTTTVLGQGIYELLSASGDGNVIGIGAAHVNPGFFSRFDVASLSVAWTKSTPSFFIDHIGVNHDGSQFAMTTYGGTYIFNGSGTQVGTVGQYAGGHPVGVAYHPTADTVFFPWVGTREVRAYNTVTLTESARYDFGYTFGEPPNINPSLGPGRMKISRDGSVVFAKVDGGIHYLRWPTAPPQISAQPSNTTTLLGSNATFSVSAIGTGPFNYQWRFNGADLDDATNATLALANVQYAQAGSYSVLVYTPYAYVTSSIVTLTVNGPPIITNQPQSQVVLAGTNVSFTVAADGTQPFSYQWLFNDTTVVGTESNLPLVNVQAANAGNYSVILNNSYGTATSAVAVLTVNGAVPLITTQPQSQTVAAGGNATFTVVASGTEPLTCQWKFNGDDLPGKTASSLTLTNVQSGDAGNYSVIVSNAVGPTVSDTATLTVNPAAPQFSGVPANVTTTRGAEVLFYGKAFGSEPIGYQWRFNNADIPGATSIPLVLTNVQGTNAGGYRAVAANAYGSATSSVATLTVTPPPGFLWARSGGGAGADGAHCLAVEGLGNVCVAGYYFGPASVGNSNLTVYGTTDLFVAKYDSAGQLLWVRSAGGSLADIAYAIAADAVGNVYVTGWLGGDADFGGVMLTNVVADLFIAKYDNAGNLLWVTKAGGASSDQGSGLALDAAGNVFLTGRFNSTASFGTNTVVSAGGSDIFVAKYDGNGNALWARKAGGGSDDEGNGVAVDRHGNVYVTGYFAASATFGTNAITGSSQEVFVAKYDGDGNLAWVAKAGGTNADYGRAISVDPDGNAYVTGEFIGTASFGNVSLTALGTFSAPDVFVAKYDGAGNVLWAARAGGTSADYGRGISVDSGGNAYVVGDFVGTATFGNTNGYSSSWNIYVAMYTAAGDCRWVRQAGANDTDKGEAVAADDRGNLFLAGSFFNGPASFGHVSLPSAGGWDFFVTKFAAFDPDLPPALTLQPSNQTAQAGATVTFNLGFVGAPPVAVQWLCNGANLIGATNNALTISNATPLQAGSYSVILSNAGGAVTSLVATLNVNVEPDFLWALGAGGPTNDEILGVACDTNGNTYVAGYFSGTANIGGTNLTSAGGEDIFVAKFDSVTNLVWVQQAGGAGDDRANCIALDPADQSVLIAGQFSGAADFRQGGILTSAGGTDIFLADFNASGSSHWALRAGGVGDDTALGMRLLPNGLVYLVGCFQGSATIAGSSLTSAGTNDIFLAKFNTGGAQLNARPAGGTGDDRGRAVTCDSAGNVFVVGSFSGTAGFSGTNLISTAGYDAFVAKYDSALNRIWARKGGTSLSPPGAGNYNDEANAIVADREGNVFVAGYFNRQATFGLFTNNAASTNQPDIFLVKYDGNGNVLWVKQAGGMGADVGNALATDLGGNAYLAGSFNGAALFNPSSVTSVGGADAFVAMYDATGRLLKVRRGGGGGDDVGQAIAVDGRGNAVAGGCSTTAAAFGGTGLTNAGGRDAFVTAVTFFNPSNAPVITTPPAGQTVSLGSNAMMTVGFVSGTVARLQWQLNGVNLPGATNSTLSLTNVQYPNLGNYTVVVSNSFGAVTSSAAVVTIELSPEFLWLQKAGGTGDDQGRAIALDADTNIYVAGLFTGTGTFFNTNLISAGSTDIFLVKMTSAGTNLWAQRAGGTGSDVASGVAGDRDGNVFVTGHFASSQATFGGLTLTNSGVGAAFPDFYLVKYDGQGRALWARKAVCTGADVGTSVAVDDAGNAYVTGSFASTATFGGIGLTNIGSTNFFLAKYDPSGNVLCAKTATGTNTCQGSGITVDGETNVYVTGFLLGSANFGSGTLTNTNGTYFGGSVFLAKYDSAGALKLAVKGIGSAIGLGQAIRADRSGNIYATSYRRDYGTNYLLTKYDAAGNRLWTRGASISCCTGDYISGDGLALDAVGNPYIAGEVTGYLTFGGLSLNRQGYVAKYRASDGALFWIRQLGQAGYGVAVDATGSAYLAGRFTGTSYFGTTNSLVSSGGNDAFIVKLGVRPPGLALTQSNRLVVAGSNLTLQVTGATGTGPFGYQWQFNGTNIARATNSSLTLTNFSAANAGRYSIIVQNTSGSVTGRVAAVGLIPVLSVARLADGVVLSWAGTFTLQSATNVAGPYLDWPLTTSPFTNLFMPGEPGRFFRLRVGNPTVEGQMLTNRWFAVSVAGSPGRNYEIEASTNLLDWTLLQTDASPFTLQDSNTPAFPQRFYRARLVP